VNTAAAPASNFLPAFHDQILTVNEVAALLKMSRDQIYEMTRHRAKVRQAHPLPTLRINGNLRFSLRAIEAWLNRLSAESEGIQ